MAVKTKPISVGWNGGWGENKDELAKMLEGPGGVAEAMRMFSFSPLRNPGMDGLALRLVAIESLKTDSPSGSVRLEPGKAGPADWGAWLEDYRKSTPGTKLEFVKVDNKGRLCLNDIEDYVDARIRDRLNAMKK